MRKPCLVVAILLAGGLAASAASATDYFLVSANQNQIALIDRDAITPDSDGGAMAPMVAIRRKPETIGLNFAYAVIDSEFDCAGRRVAATSVALFTIDGQAGPQGTSDRPLAWAAVAPNSEAEDALRFVCAKPADRGALGFRMNGLTLAQIVASVFSGPWPYGDASANRDAPSPAP